ncbi:MAG: YggS family pyridoxal phosphate-dependent enzyme [Rhodospirillaceae bacterium]|nr:YggS family pyridoxal phosphate-dependent enzyme [Rhodospirillaceae bacterium]
MGPSSPSAADAAPPDPERDAGAVGTALAEVRRRIAAAAAAAGRRADAVTLVAVSKSQPEVRIVAALEAGQRVFGENRVQEAQRRWPALRARYPGVELHLVGPLQTNKLRDALALFDVIQTLDREKLARALAAEAARGARLPPLFIEVNVGAEPQKAGVPPEAAPRFIALCRDKLGLPVVGLMCIPPYGEDPAPHFARLRDLARANGLPGVSMGMSGDYELAVRLGATHVRVGTAIFGERAPRTG